MENRLRQLDADHHSWPETARSTPSLAKLLAPGSKRPALEHSLSSVAHEMPLIGMTTTEQATLSEQPRDSFSMSVRTSNFTEPLPSASEKAAISAGGKAAPIAASGAIVSAVQEAYTVPVDPRKAVTCVEKVGGSLHSAGSGTSPLFAARSVSEAYASWRHTAWDSSIA